MTQLFDCRKAFADTLEELAASDPRVVAVTNDSIGSSNLTRFRKDFPDRFINVGIAEQDLIGISAGLANGGKIPFVCGASCFLTGRALEQIKVDLGYSRANVKLCGMSSGMAYGALGPTHHSIEDLAWTRVIPNLTVIVPADPAETVQAVRAAASTDGPFFLRLSRMPVPAVHAPDYRFEIGRAAVLRDGGDVTLIANGTMVCRALEAARLLADQGLSARVLNMSTVKPIDREAIVDAAETTGAIVTIEEHSIYGGLGGAVAEVVVSTKPVPMRILGVPGVFAPTGSAAWLFKHFGLTAERIRDAVLELLHRRVYDGQKLVLAIDQGTTNTKVLLLDSGGNVVARASRPLSINFPRPGWVEQEADGLWISVAEAIDECLAQAGDPKLAAIGITNQRESVVAWDRRTGRPAAPCVVWQCRRSATFCEDLRRRGLEPLLRERTGLAIDPLFSASKVRWLLDNIPDGQRRAEAGDLCVGTVDSWVLWNITGGAVHACDTTNASRTQLLNLRRLEWDPDLLAVFGVPLKALPEVRRSSGVFGDSAGVGRLPAGVPIASLIGDSHAALFGHAAFRPGSVKATYGTGSSLMTLTEAPVFSSGGLSTTVAWWQGAAANYALEGNIFMTGGAVQWLGEFLRLADPVPGAAALALAAPDTEGVYVVPAFAGLGAPYWNADARGLITGLTRGTTAAHVARATIESIAYQVRDVFDAMQRDVAIQLPALMTDGGASQNDFLMQFQADILGRPVIRNLSADLSLIGATWLAGLAVGYWKSLDELDALARAEDRFEPRMPEAERQKRYGGWREAVARAMLSVTADGGPSVSGAKAVQS